MVKKARKTMFIHVGTWASFTVQNPAKQAEGIESGTVGCNTLQVTKKQALEFLATAFPEHWRPKLSIRVAVSKRCLFIGSSPR